MKQLESNFTTPEQSERLLNFGVPADSADCVYTCDLIGGEKYYSISILEDELFSNYKRVWESPCVDIIPCWSAGRLMEIYDITINFSEDTDIRLSQMTVGVHSKTYIEKLIYLFERAAKAGLIDFEELEE